MAIRDLDQDTVNTIYNKLLFTSNIKAEIMDTKTVRSFSSNLTTLQNSFNVILSSFTNVNKLTEYEIKQDEIVSREKTIERKLNSAGLAGGGANIDFTILAKAFGSLTDQIEQLKEKLDELDLSSKTCDATPVDDIDGSYDIDDDDSKRRKRRKGRGRARARGRLRGFGRALGVLGVGLDIYNRLDEGQTLTQTAVGVGGGLAGSLAGGALGAKVGAGIGALFGGVGAIPGAAIGGAIGSIGGYFAGSALADKGYEAVTKPELSDISYSAKLSEFLRDSISNVVSAAAITSPFGAGIAAGAGIIDSIFGAEGAGSSENAEKAIAFFMSKGWSREQAAGIVGNLQAESTKNLNPKAFGRNDAGPGLHSYGIAQWNRDRFANLQNFARSRGTNWNDFNTQLEFIHHELNGSERRAGNNLRRATTAEQAAAIIDAQYERSTGEHRAKRIANARALIDQPSAIQSVTTTAMDYVSNLFGFRSNAAGRFGQPTANNRTTSQFRSRARPNHQGVDFGPRRPNVDGDPIFASDAGIVTSYTGSRSGYGNVIEIDHQNGYRTRYAHLSRISVSIGQRVNKGAVIGLMGNTGRSSGTHLHFEIRKDGTPVNPMPLLNSSGVREETRQTQSQMLTTPLYNGILIDPIRRQSRAIIVERPVYVPFFNGTGPRSNPPQSLRAPSNNPFNYYIN